MADKIEVNTDEVIEINPDEDGGARYRLPYGIAKGLGLKTDGMTPRQVWDMLKGKGINPDNAYEKLKEEASEPTKEDKVEEVKVEDIDGLYNEKQKQKIKDFRNDYQKKTHEFGLVVDNDGNTIVFREGKTGAVSFYYNEYKNFNNKSLIHNHPQGNTFLSPDDVRFFMETNLRTVEAIGFDGWSHTLELLPQNNSAMFYGMQKRVVDFYNGYNSAVSEGRKKAQEEYKNQPKNIVKSGSRFISVPANWTLYRKGASPRDLMNYIEYAKIIQNEIIEFSKNAVEKYGIKSTFKEEK